MKTKVKIIKEYQHMMFKVGDVGYIDGYVRGADDIPYAVVIVGKKIDYVSSYSLEVLSE
jgi:hypothetical protein